MAPRDACAFDDIPDGGKKALKIDGTPLLLFRRGDRVHALHNRCAHLNLPLSSGKFDGTHITCAFHGARFEVQSGRMDKKAWLLGGIIGKDCVKSYAATVEGGRVLVEL